jgi:hypothetical protein
MKYKYNTKFDINTYLDPCICGHVRNAHAPACDLCYDEMGYTVEERIKNCPEFRLKDKQ